MDPFYRQDIFFFITTIAVIIVTLALAVAAVYIIKILRDVKYISRKARAEADIISDELSELRENVRSRGAKLKYFSSFFSNIYRKSKNK